jgi:hypothetical protein
MISAMIPTAPNVIPIIAPVVSPLCAGGVSVLPGVLDELGDCERESVTVMAGDGVLSDDSVAVAPAVVAGDAVGRGDSVAVRNGTKVAF